MKAKHWHRIFLYGFTATVLVGYIITRDINLWTLLSHMVGPLMTYELGNIVGTVGAAGTPMPKV